jgi:hypothetical protein
MEFMPEVSKRKLIFKFLHTEISKKILLEVVMWNDDPITWSYAYAQL